MHGPMLETNECARRVGDLSAFLSVADERSPCSSSVAIQRPVSVCWYRATFPGLSCLRSFVLSQPVLSRVDRSAWCSSNPSAGADFHLILCSWNCSLKGPNATVQAGASAQLNRGKVRIFNYALAWRAGKIHPLPAHG